MIVRMNTNDAYGNGGSTMGGNGRNGGGMVNMLGDGENINAYGNGGGNAAGGGAMTLNKIYSKVLVKAQSHGLHHV